MGADFKRFKERKNRHNMSGSENSRKRETIFFLIILLEASLQLYMPILNLIFIIKI